MGHPPALQAAIEEQHRRYTALLESGAERVGWKLAFEIDEIAELIGSEPCVGYLTSASRLDGHAFDPAGSIDLRVDCEVAIQLAADIAPTDDLAFVSEQIAAVATGLELVDVGAHRGSFHDLIADNVTHRAFAIGPAHPPPDSGNVGAKCWVNGDLVATASAKLEFAQGILGIARLLELVGDGLRMGDWIITGSQTQVPVRPGDEIAVEIDDLGIVTAAIASSAPRATPGA